MAEQAPDPMKQPWMKADVAATLPPIKRQFDRITEELNQMTLHELIRQRDIAQERHAGKLAEWKEREEQDSGKGGRGEDSGGSSMISDEKPAPRPAPPKVTGAAVDRHVKQDSLLKEQYQSARLNAAAHQNQTPAHESEQALPTRTLTGPSR